MFKNFVQIFKYFINFSSKKFKYKYYYNISSEKYNHQIHFEDIIYQKTNINYSGGTSRAKYFQIRGIGELSQFPGEGPPHFYVVFIVDDIDFSGIGLIGFLDDIIIIPEKKITENTMFLNIILMLY